MAATTEVPANAAAAAAAGAASAPPPDLPTMNVVVVGHVDHGKSTVVGRLLHDTGVLPHGKIEQVRSNCERSGKPFEYAFLIDALQDEQAQGITIDAARVFFRSDKRRYIIIDAPGHIEFLKNMISGAARAEAAILVIDASEGVRENSRRHGFMAAMLGIRQLLVVVNKMDLVDYDEAVFTAIRDEYEAFLGEIQVEPRGFIPVSGRYGDNLVAGSERTPWYEGAALLEQIDAFASAGAETAQALRLPVQDVYKFPVRGDDARIIAGTVATGSVRVGDAVEFLPSRKRARVRSVEGFRVASREQGRRRHGHRRHPDRGVVRASRGTDVPGRRTGAGGRHHVPLQPVLAGPQPAGAGQAVPAQAGHHPGRGTREGDRPVCSMRPPWSTASRTPTRATSAATRWPSACWRRRTRSPSTSAWAPSSPPPGASCW